MFEEVDQLRLVLSHPGVDRKTKENILIETCQDSMDSSFIDFLKSSLSPKYGRTVTADCRSLCAFA